MPNIYQQLLIAFAAGGLPAMLAVWVAYLKLIKK
jgi:hypothetical protein